MIPARVHVFVSHARSDSVRTSLGTMNDKSGVSERNFTIPMEYYSMQRRVKMILNWSVLWQRRETHFLEVFATWRFAIPRSEDAWAL